MRPINRRRFVESLTEVALDQVIDGEVEALRNPPGRKPPSGLAAQSTWFNGLDEVQQSMVLAVARSIATGVLHRVLVVIDGAATIGETGEDRLRLTWADDHTEIEVSDAAGEPYLHDLFTELLDRRDLTE